MDPRFNAQLVLSCFPLKYIYFVFLQNENSDDTDLPCGLLGLYIIETLDRLHMH